MRRQRSITVTIPAGIDNGQVITLSGQGDAGLVGLVDKNNRDMPSCLLATKLVIILPHIVLLIYLFRTSRSVCHIRPVIRLFFRI